jgi:hypothetical protein
MTPSVRVETVESRPIAAVRRHVRAGEVGAAWKPALDQVWAFLGRHPGLRTDGHNLFLYHHAARRGDPMVVDFGVEVTRAFEHEAEVISTATPAGEVATTVHVGPFAALAEAHNAIDAWRAAAGREFGACSWEIYGDWTDPAKLETQVVYLLA